ncbi:MULTISPECIES: SDR family oxidoreductase [unclassified Caballeronia]|uniref:SDR family oxidoreductase n=1 Tax=unclassified Caballeronia TaxID=2646786 RepID=UPI00285BA721|nr:MULTISPECIES: SDR family oxidoreductase [unclassified Caballeronia]MDR5752431.1 SDR family oxidoreductase [Caballeronia sp. LZ024]MDR5845237.1 SDR family oxidoreductase [Caballeronia sp. LZ031]
MTKRPSNLNSAMVLPPATVLVVGATGSIGRLVVAEALRLGYAVRALIRDEAKARRVLPPETQLIVGEVTSQDGLTSAVEAVDAVVFTLGAGSMRGELAEAVDYGGVRNVLMALGHHKPRIALMTAIGVTKREDPHLGPLGAHDWKRRSERLVRASGCVYTIVRPGWFDYNEHDQQRLVLLQGDTRWASDSSDGVVSRQQVADVLVHSLSTSAAAFKTVELVAERGHAPQDFNALFAPVIADPSGAVDAVLDIDNMPLEKEPTRIRGQLAAMRVAGH